MPPLRILLVDDDDGVRDYTAMVLEEAGYEVRVASRADAALKLLGTGEPFDLLITDVVMPGWDGTELASRVRAIRPDLKVLYVTGYTRHIQAERLVGADVLDKPYQRAKLLHAVHHALAASGSRHQDGGSLERSGAQRAQGLVRRTQGE